MCDNDLEFCRNDIEPFRYILANLDPLQPFAAFGCCRLNGDVHPFKMRGKRLAFAALFQRDWSRSAFPGQPQDRQDPW